MSPIQHHIPLNLQQLWPDQKFIGPSSSPSLRCPSATSATTASIELVPVIPSDMLAVAVLRASFLDLLSIMENPSLPSVVRAFFA